MLGMILQPSHSSAAVEPMAPLSEPTVNDSTGGVPLVARVVDASAGALVADAVDSFNVRLPTGPFASRTSGPVGPIAARPESDLAPAVDRHERGLLQEVDGLNEVDAPEVAGRRSQLAHLDRAIGSTEAELSTDAGALDGAVVSIWRRGGFPFKVTGSPTGQRADLLALLASLPAVRDSERPTVGLTDTDHSIATTRLALGPVARAPGDHSEPPDYVTAAWGLALGVGLSTGPLFADLLSVVQGRLPRWLLGVRGRRRSDDRAVSSRHRKARFWNWARRSTAAL
jgi:hypothetical protein